MNWDLCLYEDKEDYTQLPFLNRFCNLCLLQIWDKTRLLIRFLVKSSSVWWRRQWIVHYKVMEPVDWQGRSLKYVTNETLMNMGHISIAVHHGIYPYRVVSWDISLQRCILGHIPTAMHHSMAAISLTGISIPGVFDCSGTVPSLCDINHDTACSPCKTNYWRISPISRSTDIRNPPSVVRRLSSAPNDKSC
jgi:hypothetical protein